ncbi:MAG: hypothetical protein IKC77_07690, partial [Lentisphaeria bacterium]|nr:hypothetical protein [Lentisphaeria bacterium]
MEKYSACHCLRHNLAVHYAANNSVQHTQTPNTAANICVSLRGSAKNIPASPHTHRNTNKKTPHIAAKNCVRHTVAGVSRYKNRLTTGASVFVTLRRDKGRKPAQRGWLSIP